MARCDDELFASRTVWFHKMKTHEGRLMNAEVELLLQKQEQERKRGGGLKLIGGQSQSEWCSVEAREGSGWC